MRVIAALDVRARFGQVLNEAASGERFIVERAGQPVAAIVPLGDLDAIDPDSIRARRLAAVDALVRLRDRGEPGVRTARSHVAGAAPAATAETGPADRAAPRRAPRAGMEVSVSAVGGHVPDSGTAADGRVAGRTRTTAASAADRNSDAPDERARGADPGTLMEPDRAAGRAEEGSGAPDRGPVDTGWRQW